MNEEVLPPMYHEITPQIIITSFGNGADRTYDAKVYSDTYQQLGPTLMHNDLVMLAVLAISSYRDYWQPDWPIMVDGKFMSKADMERVNSLREYLKWIE